MAATMATMAVLNAKCLSLNSPKSSKPIIPKPISLKGFTSKLSESSNLSTSLTGTAIAGAVFSTLSSCDAALAAQHISDLAAAAAGGSDNRGLALLLPIVPAVGWVLFNILQPALNQLNRMKSTKGVIVGIGLGLGSGLAASGFMHPPEASANEISMIAEAAANDNRGTLLLFVIAPAIGWVLFNILQPALNQLNRMRSE